MSARKPVTVRFRFNQDTGQIEEFLIDDQDRTASESYHDRIARAIAGQLFRTPQVVDAGTIPDAPPVPATPATESTPDRHEEARG